MKATSSVKAGDQIDLSIEGMNGQGLGFGFHEGLKIFVPFTMQGDKIRASIETVTSKFTRAQCTDIITPSLNRVPAPCPHFGICGGCQLQHLNPKTYVDTKHHWVTHSIERSGFASAAILPMVEIGPNSRRRLVFKVQEQDGVFSLGFFQEASHTVVDIQSCLIAKQPLIEYAFILKEWLPLLINGTSIKEIHLTYHQNTQTMDAVFSAIVPLSNEDKKIIVDKSTRHTFPQRLNWICKGEIQPIIDFPVYTQLGDAHVSLPVMAFLQATQEAQTVMTDFILNSLKLF